MLNEILYATFVLAAVLLGWRFWKSVERNPGVRRAKKQSGGVYYFTAIREPVEDFVPQRRGIWKPGRFASVMVFWATSLWIFFSSLEVLLFPETRLLNFFLSVAFGFPLVFLSMVWFAKK